MRQLVLFLFFVVILSGFALLLSDAQPSVRSLTAQSSSAYDANGNPVETYGTESVDFNSGYSGEYYETYDTVYPTDGTYYYWDYPSYDSYYSAPSAPLYVQLLPGVGNVAQPIVQTLVPQTQSTPSPTCAIAASPNSVAYGGSATLQWISRNTQWADLTDLGIVNISGSWQFDNLRTSKTYTLNISGPGGTGTCSTYVSVSAQQQTPTCSITATPGVVAAGGGVTLSWSSLNASAAALTGQGTVPSTGSSVVYPTQSMTYTLAVGNSAGQTNTCTTDVTVQQTNTIPVYQYQYQAYPYNYYQSQYQLPTCNVSVSPASVYRGGSVDVSWSSMNASQGTLTDVGAVGASGFTRVSPNVSHPIVLGVSNQYGTNACSTYVTVNDLPDVVPETPTPMPEEPAVPQTPRPSCSLKFSPEIIAVGATTTLSWNTTNANSAKLSDIGSIPVNGSMILMPSLTGTYTLTVSGEGGTRSCTAAVTAVPCPSSCANTAPVQPQQSGGFWKWLASLFGA